MITAVDIQRENPTMSNNATLETSLHEQAESAFGPSLRKGETIVSAGTAMIPPAWWTLIFASVVRALQTYFVVLTDQRLVLLRTNSWTGKMTPNSVMVKRQFELRSIRAASLRGNAAILQTASGAVKLVGVRLAGIPLTPSNFLGELVSYVNRPSK
jgi:hypothetical protein